MKYDKRKYDSVPASCVSWFMVVGLENNFQTLRQNERRIEFIRSRRRNSGPLQGELLPFVR